MIGGVRQEILLDLGFVLFGTRHLGVSKFWYKWHFPCEMYLYHQTWQSEMFPLSSPGL